MKKLIFQSVTFILLFGNFLNCASINMKCDSKTFDENMMKINGHIFESNLDYPKSINDFKPFCNKIKEGEQYLKQYLSHNCVQGSSRTMLSVYLYSSTRVNKKFCSNKANPKIKSDLVKIGNCVRNHKKLTKECNKIYINKLNITHSIENGRNKIPYICCLSVQVKHCIVDSLAKQNDPNCSEKILEDVAHSIEQHGGNTMNTFCENIEESDRCNAILKLPTIKPKLVSDPTAFRVILRIFETL